MAHSSASRASNPNALHALIIGINNYPLAYPYYNLPTLKAAISDAAAFERYLLEDLRVPTQNIRNLLGANATRSNILGALQFLGSDNNIGYGDAIVIYYAGHGGTAPASPGLNIREGAIQMIFPSDVGPSVYGIPDWTFGTLLRSIAISKGDNITVILDCCFSGSGTRSDNDSEERGAFITVPFPSGLDEEILAINIRGTSIPEGFLHDGLRSHVLLAACNSHERAREAHGSGYFTEALLGTLKSMRINTLTYTELMNHLPKLPNQNPQCEGHNRNRILFSTQVINNSSFHQINRTPGGGYEISVGQAYGITQSTLFVVYPSHPSRQDTDRGPPLQGYVAPLHISNFNTLLNIPTYMAAMISQDAVVLQVRAGVERAFPICISDRSGILNDVVDRVRHEMEKRGMREVEVVSNPNLAKLGLNLALNTTHQNEVVLIILDPSISQWGLSKIHQNFPLPPSFKALFPVLSAAARFDWHLHRASRGITTSQVDIEFTRLSRDRVPNGPNMIENDKNVFVDVSEKAMYGIKLTNKIDLPLYVSVFYFDSSDLSIASLFESPVSTSQSIAEPPLKPQQPLTIGYGSSGSTTFQCFLREGQTMDVGTLKFYFSTEAVDLSYIRQEPFAERRAGELVVNSDITRGYYSPGQVRRSAWGTVEIQIIQKDKIVRRGNE